MVLRTNIILSMLLFAMAILISGCGDFFIDKPTEIQAMKIVEKVATIKEDVAPSNPVPEIYRAAPQIMHTPKGIKLFYFTKHHSPNKLGPIVTAQMGIVATVNTETNQMIMPCATEQEAESVIEFLKKVDVRPIQVKVDCIIVEHYADVTMDRETITQIDNLFGASVTLDGKIPGATLREPLRKSFGLNMGFDNFGIDGHVIKTTVDMLVSRGYMKVLMNPTVETLNGKKATITSRDKVPLTKIVAAANIAPYQVTEYEWVVDRLEVTPYIYSDGTIGLTTSIKMGSKQTPEGVAQLPIITDRSIEVQENRLSPGKSMIIGGFKKTERRSVVRGVPFLKDIPIIGLLFSSKDFEERAKEITFILTPSISSNGMEYSKMIDMVRQNEVEPEYIDSLERFITDPLGVDYSRKSAQRQAAQEEVKRIRAEIDAAKTEREASEARAKLRRYQAKMKIEAQKVAQASSRVVELESQLETAKVEGDAIAKQAAQQQQSSQAQTDAARAQTQQATAKTAKLQAELDETKQQAQQLQQEAETLKARNAKTEKEIQDQKAVHEKAIDEIKSQAEKKEVQESQPPEEKQENLEDVKEEPPASDPEAEATQPQQ